MVETATFAIELEDDTSGAAEQAAQSLERLQERIDDDVKALREMQRAMRNLKGGTATSSAAFKELRDRITAKKTAVAAAQEQFIELGGTFGTARKKAREAAGGVGELGGDLARAGGQTRKFSGGLGELEGMLARTGGPLATMSSRISRLGALLSNPLTLVLALAAALVTFAAATGAAVAALFRYGVAQSDARRSEALRLEGLNTLRRAYGLTTASVEAMQAAIDRASDSTNLGRTVLAGYARQLSRAGLRGDALTDAVQAMGIAAMVQGDRGAARFRALAIQARLTGGSVRDLAEDYRRRLGPIARRQMLSLDNQTTRLRRNLERIFSGLRLESFLSGIAQVADLFSQSTASGRALKSIVEALFQPMLDQLGRLAPLARAFFQGMVIGALLLAIAFVRVRSALREAFGDSTLLKNTDLVRVALFAGAAAMFVFAAAVGIVAVALTGLVALVGATVAAFAVVVGLVPAAIVGLFMLGQAIGRTINDLREIDVGSLASAIVGGLVAGLTAGASRVQAAMRGLAQSATRSFRETLGIASPSRVFAELGGQIGEGVMVGVDRSAGGVDDAVNRLVDVPEGGAVGGTVSVTIGDVVVQAGQTDDPDALAEAVRDRLADLLSGLSIELGAT